MQRERDLVSVVIPCYNQGIFLKNSVQSILDQTYKNYEIIIVNDGSDERSTIGVLKEIDHPSVTVLNKKNGHVASARNYGIRHSRGQYILTLDADDQFMPDFLKKAVPYLENNSVIGVVTCYAKVVNNESIIKYVYPSGGGVENFLANNNCMASALFRYECWEQVGGYDESYNAITKGFEDWDFWLQVLRGGWKIYSIREYLIKYRKTEGSMSSEYKEDIPEMMRRLVSKHEDVFREHATAVVYEKELKIQKLKEITQSWTYRLGKIIFYPVASLRRHVNDKKRKFNKNKVAFIDSEAPSEEDVLVSVVIPCYNHGCYLQESLLSVLNQTYKNVEIIIVDDGSDDIHTQKVLDEILHPKVKVIRKENGHVASARNYGIRHSRGQFVLTLDADDRFNTGFLKRAVSILKNDTSIGVVTCYASLFDKDHNHIATQHKKGGSTEDFLVENNSMASALFRHQCWVAAGGFNESYNESNKGFEDWDFWLSVTRAGWNVFSIPEYLIEYRITPGSMSAEYKDDIPIMMKRLVIKHLEVYQENIVNVVYKKELKIQRLRNIRYSFTYRLGHCLLFPLKVIHGLYIRIRKGEPLRNKYPLPSEILRI
ncbi:MAG: glycosyltransferase family A protein [Balneolales bacterium]